MEIDISLSQLKKTYNSYFNSTEQEYQASKSKFKSKSVDLHKDEPSYIKLTPKIENVKSISNFNEMDEMDEMDSMANEVGEEGRNPNDQTTLLPTQTNRNDTNAKNVSSDKSSQQSLMTGVNNPMNEMVETDNESDNNNDNNNCIENKHEDESKNENQKEKEKENEKSINKKEEEEDVVEMNDMAPSWAFDTLEEEIEYLRNVNLRLRYELEVSNANTNQSSSLASAFAGVGGRGCGGGCDGDNDDDSKLELKIQNNDLTHKLNKDKKVSFAMNKAFLNNAKVSPYEFSQRVQSKLPQFLRNEENNNGNGNGKFVSNVDDTTNKDTIYIPSMIENEIGIIDIKHVDWWDIVDYDSIDCDDDYLKSNLNNTIDGQNTSDQMVFNNGVALDGPFVLVRESDVVDAVACFVAQCVIKMPECRNLSHDQMLKLLDGTFAELREKGPIGKLIQWGQMGYSAYGYGKYAWTLYTNPLVAEVVMAAFAQAVIFFGVL